MTCSKRTHEVDDHVTALIEFTEEGSRILYSVSKPHIVRNGHENPDLTPMTLHGGEHGDAEWVVSLHENDGDVIRSVAFDKTNRIHSCVASGEGYVGGPVPADKQYQLVSLKVPKEGGFLTIHESELTNNPDGDANHIVATTSSLALQTRNHGTYILSPDSLGTDAPEVKATIDHYLEENEPDTSTVISPSLILKAPQDLSGSAFTSADVPPHFGRVESFTKLVSAGPVESSFNIVLTGDGYDSTEVGQYKDLAQRLAFGIMAAEPFRSMSDEINIYSLATISEESGISKCSQPGDLKTFYGIEGHFDWGTGPSSATFLGTHFPEMIHFQIGKHIDWRAVGITIVIANCPGEGGSGLPGLGLSFVTASTTSDPNGVPPNFVRTALHEIGHGVGLLAEEYVSGFDDHGWVYPNLARASDIKNGTVPWQHLAHPDELNPDGTFKFQHHVDDPLKGTCSGSDDTNCLQFPCEPVIPGVESLSDTTLGLFWGCQNLEAGADANDRSHVKCGLMDTRGANFYRASPNCIMRSLNKPFCRVCQDALRTRVRAQKGFLR